MKVLIIGGTGEMGQWFTPFFKNHGYEVVVWGSSGKVEVAERMGVEFASDLDAEIGTSDIVIVTVPINITERVISETAPKMKSGSLLMDFTSLKVGPTEAMKKYAPEDVEILGTHPMFGPSIPSLHGQIFILTPIEGRCDKWFPVMRSLFEDNGAHIEVITPAEHDRFVSVVQGLTHFAYITIGTTFDALDFSVNESRRFMSPVYDIMLDFVGRILGQNPYLYAYIQMENPEVLKVHDAFMNQCSEMSSIVRKKDVEAFTNKMKDAAVHFGDTASALRRSDKLINSKIAEFDRLLDSIGQEIGVRHIYSGIVHTGIIKKVSPRDVVLECGSRMVPLKIENIRLLDEEELHEWKLENLEHHLRDISVLIPEEANADVIMELVSCNDDIVSIEIIDRYEGVEGTKRLSVTFRVMIMGDVEAEKVHLGIERQLMGIGCSIRGW
ncbi:prephenate dehydrogenase [Methanolobus tindarius DSM 2278]|uniref:Prephenate dehydrogenase n=1 Tax=Methanolobus tindarius DSM 2278 TaxID=1090322 RepID=W9DXE1_METTI|nr:prephenate dehydrogenase [Methanolobus tindarius]ETA68372.1 prephenate dehydrogenase [Methanolobus tindarius DSM 2278]